jgi:two-component system, NtrC family, nitrogen regulation sensor histidine kinase NtrY
MGSRPDFTLGLLWRLLLLAAAAAVLAAAVVTPDLAAARVVAAAGLGGAGWLLWRHITRTNREIARFVEAVTLGDLQVHFDRGAGGGFGPLARAFDGAIARLRAERDDTAQELRYCQTLLDDVPVALLVVGEGGRVDLANKAARRLFRRHAGARPDDYATYGAGFAARLEPDAPDGTDVLVLNLGRVTRAVIRSATLTRLGRRTRAITVEPVQDALNAVEMATQTDIVRVLTHEILNSLTPVRSLAATALDLLGEAGGTDPRLADARTAVGTLARRAEGLERFIGSYRAVARELTPHRRAFMAAPFVAELAQLFAADWPGVALASTIVPAELAIDADPDLLAQALINLLRNAGEAARAGGADPAVALSVGRRADGGVEFGVADNGPGVPAELRGDIFLPFFTTRPHGTGVGLNLVRRIAAAHGGSVEVETAPSGGALFRLIV